MPLAETSLSVHGFTDGRSLEDAAPFLEDIAPFLDDTAPFLDDIAPFTLSLAEAFFVFFSLRPFGVLGALTLGVPGFGSAAGAGAALGPREFRLAGGESRIPARAACAADPIRFSTSAFSSPLLFKSMSLLDLPLGS